ncbi:MAG: hypothetical protein RLY20_2083 [Verrucomicrobiota bacterium]|jgi:4'-phosphopantetheinyl transferase
MALKVPQSLPAKAADPGALVDLWTVRLDASAHTIESAQQQLSPEERMRVSEFRNEIARRNFVIARAALRLILGRHLEIDAPSIQFSLGAQGKPALAGTVAGKLEFNLTHSGDLALVATSRQTVVGIDVERMRPMPDALRIAERFFSKDESAKLKMLTDTERSAAFLNLWTRKEALAKATGIGIANTLARFAVTSGDEAIVTAIDGDTRQAAEWTLHAFRPVAGYVGAVAARSPRAQFALQEFHLPS